MAIGKRPASRGDGRKATDAEEGGAHIHRGRPCTAASLASLALTNRAAAFSSTDNPVANRTLLVNLTVGGGAAVTATLIISTLIPSPWP